MFPARGVPALFNVLRVHKQLKTRSWETSQQQTSQFKYENILIYIKIRSKWARERVKRQLTKAFSNLRVIPVRGNTLFISGAENLQQIVITVILELRELEAGGGGSSCRDPPPRGGGSVLVQIKICST